MGGVGQFGQDVGVGLGNFATGDLEGGRSTRKRQRQKDIDNEAERKLLTEERLKEELRDLTPTERKPGSRRRGRQTILNPDEQTLSGIKTLLFDGIEIDSLNTDCKSASPSAERMRSA